MLQQTTVVTVIPYFQRFLARWPTVHDLASAIDSDVMAQWAGLGYYARARNLLKSARVISLELAGAFPQTPKALQKLPGIGPYTAGAITAIAFDQRARVLDGNIERVMARLYAVTTPLPECKPKLESLAFAATPTARIGDYVQAVMDLGATICTPRNPECNACPLTDNCTAFAQGIAKELPKRHPKPAKPTRQGIIYFAYTDCGKTMLETRPPKGLLGGMLGFPSTNWAESPAQPNPPLNADWRKTPSQVRHVFTHFKLELTVMVAKIPVDTAETFGFVDFPAPETLPSVMQKAFNLALKNVQNCSRS